MEAFFASTLIVTIGEIGDKTQLLALILAARYRRPVPILFGILCATLANHALAGLAGEWIGDHLSPDLLRWGLAASFALIGLWALKPDSFDETPDTTRRWGAFAVTLIAFFVAEIGDKTQLATVALAVKYPQLLAVVAGTTLGMMIANIPAVFAGEALIRRIPLKLFRFLAAGLFLLMAAATFFKGDAMMQAATLS